MRSAGLGRTRARCHRDTVKDLGVMIGLLEFNSDMEPQAPLGLSGSGGQISLEGLGDPAQQRRAFEIGFDKIEANIEHRGAVCEPADRDQVDA